MYPLEPPGPVLPASYYEATHAGRVPGQALLRSRRLWMAVAILIVALGIYLPDVPSRLFWLTPYGAQAQQTIRGALLTQQSYEQAPPPWAAGPSRPVLRRLMTAAGRAFGRYYTGGALQYCLAILRQTFSSPSFYRPPYARWRLQWVRFGHVSFGWDGVTISTQDQVGDGTVNRVNTRYVLVRRNGRWLITHEDFLGYVTGYGP